ncbi:1-acyl-sn-glycerol-3-phosphate acyltransferase [Myxococcus stipitatus]|uniref:lysophospholipid acyltransferase family protein n=1 Tax=Myxococcus stipitatus TaxID=83455 RepID=UPI003145626D
MRHIELHEQEALSRMERLYIRMVRKSFEPGRLDTAIRWCQRSVGARWIHFANRHLLHVVGYERVPPLDPAKSYVLASNHRSFFDLYVTGAFLMRQGLHHRMVFPVRSNFFYDSPLGFLVNGSMSFFAMYPPLFRERSRQSLNLASLQEVVRLLQRGGTLTGVHPEGTRNQGPDPYTLLPAQSGVGRIIHQSRATVIPLFINGLTNSIVRQFSGNLLRTGSPVVLVFGEPLAMDDLLAQPGGTRVYKQVSERLVTTITALGQEERAARARLGRESSPQWVHDH